jgi:hypothetical protein
MVFFFFLRWRKEVGLSSVFLRFKIRKKSVKEREREREREKREREEREKERRLKKVRKKKTCAPPRTVADARSDGKPAAARLALLSALTLTLLKLSHEGLRGSACSSESRASPLAPA